jgi:hypothetical protein
MKPVTLVLTAASLAVPCSVVAQDVFPDVEYIQGKSGMSQKIKGQLVISPSGIAFLSKEGSSVFTLPLTIVKEVTNSLQTDPGSFGRKVMLGAFASKREEFVYVNTETPERAEVIVFKCHKKNASPDILAKVKFYLAKAKAAPADSQPH